MSRSHHHGKRSQKKYSRWNDWRSEPAPPKKKRSYVEPHFYWMHTPTWWVRLVMTGPQRRQVRDLILKCYRLPDIEDVPLFPLAKKPHIYFW